MDSGSCSFIQPDFMISSPRSTTYRPLKHKPDLSHQSIGQDSDDTQDDPPISSHERKPCAVAWLMTVQNSGGSTFPCLSGLLIKDHGRSWSFSITKHPDKHKDLCCLSVVQCYSGTSPLYNTVK